MNKFLTYQVYFPDCETFNMIAPLYIFNATQI